MLESASMEGALPKAVTAILPFKNRLSLVRVDFALAGYDIVDSWFCVKVPIPRAWLD